MRLRKLACVCALAGLAGGWSSAVGQVLGTVGDTDPANDLIGGANVLPLTSNGVVVIRGNLVGAGTDVDNFSIALDSGDVMTVITAPIQNLPVDFFVPDTSVSIHDSVGTELVVNADAGSDYGRTGVAAQVHGAVVRFRAAAAGTYYVRVFADGFNESGLYVATVSLHKGGSTQFAESEPNGTLMQARFIDLATSGPMLGAASISPANDVDVYGLELRGGDSVLAVVTPNQNLPTDFSTPDTIMDVLDSSGAVLLTNDDSGDESPTTGVLGTGSAVRFRAPGDGNYFLRVRGFNNVVTGTYLLTLSTIPGRPCVGDADRNGFIDFSDIIKVLAGFGTVCP